MFSVEFFGLVGSVVASLVALTRWTMREQRATQSQFVASLEAALARQEAHTARLADTLDGLRRSLDEQNTLWRRLAEEVGRGA